MVDYHKMPMLNVAKDILKNHEGKMKIMDLMQQTLEAKGLEDKDNEYKTQLYLDITTSSLFVYMGDEEWDLKDRQSLAMYDRDGAEFNTVEDEQSETEDEDILNFEDEDEEDENEEEYDEDEENEEDYDDEDEEDDEDLEHDENGEVLERYHEDDDDFDEDKYNDYMDDFENMYDDN